MPDNKIQIIFEAIDKGVKKTVDDIKSTLGEAGAWSGDFEEAGLAAAGFTSILAAAGIAAKFVVGQLDEVVKLSEKRPELFTAEQLANVTAYGEEVSKLKDEFEKTKIEVVSGIAPALTDLLERSNASARAMELAAAAGKNWAFISEQQADAFIEMAIAEEGAIEAAEVFDRVLLSTAESSTESTDIILENGKKQLSMMEELAGASEEETAKIIYNNLLQKLSVDGITNAELEMATQAGLALGILDERSIETAIKINDLTNQVIAGTFEVENLGNALNNLQDRTINVQVNATGSGLAMIGGEGATKAAVGIKAKRAGGGPVSGGSSYVVGEAGPEIFSPGSSGSVSSNDSLIMAIERSKIDEARLARLIVNGMLKGMAQQ